LFEVWPCAADFARYANLGILQQCLLVYGHSGIEWTATLARPTVEDCRSLLGRQSDDVVTCGVIDSYLSSNGMKITERLALGDDLFKAVVLAARTEPWPEVLVGVLPSNLTEATRFLESVEHPEDLTKGVEAIRWLGSNCVASEFLNAVIPVWNWAWTYHEDDPPKASWVRGHFVRWNTNPIDSLWAELSREAVYAAVEFFPDKAELNREFLRRYDAGETGFEWLAAHWGDDVNLQLALLKRVSDTGIASTWPSSQGYRIPVEHTAAMLNYAGLAPDLRSAAFILQSLDPRDRGPVWEGLRSTWATVQARFGTARATD
jgi:hypothetical protein